MADRQRFEARLGHSLAHVRVHRDALAAASADAVAAAAYTVGSHVVWGRDAGPGSRAHEWTLAHELAHVVQQRDGALAGAIPLGAPDSHHERAADRTAHHLLRGSIAPPPSAAPLQLARQPRLTIVDVESGPTEKELKVIVDDPSWNK
jgi:hypothetical protein